MSGDPPPIEQQRFARSQTPESPRPVHLPEPAKIPVLLNQMDEASNDLATYNIPSDQTFAHYGDSLENPAYKSSPSKEEHDPFRDFLRQADSVVANPPEPTAAAAAAAAASTAVAVPPASITSPHHATTNANASVPFTNPAGLPFLPPQLHLNTAPPESHGPASHGRGDPLAAHAQQPTTAQEEDIVASEAPGHGPTPTPCEAPADPATPAHAAGGASQFPTESGVDYQSLLDTIAQSASAAPAAERLTAQTTDADVPRTQPSALPAFPGLPPKPPPLEVPNGFPLSTDPPAAQQPPPSATAEDPDLLRSAANALPSANFDPTAPASSTATQASGMPHPLSSGMTDEHVLALPPQYHPPAAPPDTADAAPTDRPWSPKTQAIYDAFLEDERRYVTEGIWDRFPLGSRLFVGNLPSEKVTKRDLFHQFHRHGRLAQISIKQAYGFVQYHRAEDCQAALDAEQGVEIRGRKVHLEISKPQKGSKASQHSKSQNQHRRRSRSPPRRSYSDFRDEPNRRRDDYRHRRSPSPPRFRRDDRPGSREDRRSQLYGTNYSTAYPPAYEDEASLPYPRRDPRYAPDVQIIVLDSAVPQAFINWVEDGFKRKNLAAASTWLNQRTPLPAVVKRQIVEGVQAVVKLSPGHHTRSKIPLQVFDRSAGTSNVTFNEYVDLDVHVAADIVIQARQRERGSAPLRPPYPPSYPLPHPYPHPPSPAWPPPNSGMPYPPLPPQPPAPQPYQYPSQPHPSYRAPQPPQGQYPTPGSAHSNPANLQELLANLKGGSNAPPTPQSAHAAGQPHTPYAPLAPVQYPYGPPQQGTYGQPPYPQQPPQPPQDGQQNVQYLLDQMTRNR